MRPRGQGPEGAPASTGDQPGGGEHDATPSESRWDRLLDNKTGLQRAVISLGALAAAAIAISAVVAAVLRFVDDDEARGDLDDVPTEAVRIESGTDAADDFVRALDERHGSVAILDHQLIAEKGPADVRLQYDCTDQGVCVMARIQDVDVEATDMADGLWFAGCFAVTRDGAGYGFEPLDLELRYQGETCP